MSGKYSIKTGGAEYSIIYSDMHGVDLCGDGSNISKNRFAYLENMYRDYDGGDTDALVSIPGYRKIFDTDDEVFGLFHHTYEGGEDALAVHSGDALYLLDTNGSTASPKKIYSGLKRGKSDAYFSKNALFIIDGQKIVKVKNADAKDADSEAYIPTLCMNYEEFEQRNLYTRSFYETYNVGSLDDISYATEGLTYAVTDADNLYCKITGYTGSDTNVYIPTKAKIGDKLYTVKEIDVYAFEGKDVEECFISGGVEKIGNLAFYDCSALSSVLMGEGVKGIGQGAFEKCTSLAFTEYENCLYIGSASNPYFALVGVLEKEYEIHEDTRVIADGVLAD